MLQDILANVMKGIDADRADVVKTAISTVRECESRDEGFDLKLDRLLNGLCCPEGTILHFAVSREAVDSIRTILQARADISIQNRAGHKAVDLIQGHSKAMEVFNQELLQSVAKSDSERVSELLAGGVAVNFEDTADSRNTPLHWAAAYGNEAVVSTLLEHGAMVNAINAEGCSALHDAAHRGHAAIIQLLLSSKANPSGVATSGKCKGKTPVNLAAAQGLENLFFAHSPSNNNINGYMPATNGHGGMPSLSPANTTQPITSLVLSTLRPDSPPPGGDVGLVSSSSSFTTPISSKFMTPITSKVTSTPIISTPNGLLTPVDIGKMATGSDIKNGVPLSTPVQSTSLTSSLESPQLTGPATDVASLVVPSESEGRLDQVSREKLDLLWPIPQQIVALEGPPFDPGEKIIVAAVNGPSSSAVHDILNVWRALRSSFEDLNLVAILEPLPFSTSPGMAGFGLSAVVCQVNPRIFKQAESYRITVKSDQVKIVASDLPGMHYGVSAFIQLLELFDETGHIPPLQINDWPDLKSRGVLLDMSMGRIPHEDTLWDLVDRLSILKVNELHVYHRFNVSAKEDAFYSWQFPYSRTVLMDVDRFCSQRHMALIPVLDVGPKVTFDQVVMLFGAFSDFLSCFSNTEYINVGPRLSSFLLEVSGDGSMRAMHFLPSSTHTLQVCGSIFNPSCFKNSFSYLPSNMMLMEYGYQADFEFPNTKLYCANGVPFSVCPGTSSWNCMAGCPAVAIQNIANAAQCCHDNNGVGMLVCNWSGRGHVTHGAFSMLPMVAAAGFCWNKSTTFTQAMDRIPSVTSYYMIVDQNQIIGRVLMDLGMTETLLNTRALNRQEDDLSEMMGETGSILFQLLTTPDSVDLTYLTHSDFQKAIRSIRQTQEEMLHADLDCLQSKEIVAEVAVTCDLMMAACRIGHALLANGKNPTQEGDAMVNMGVANLHPTTKTDLSNRLLGCVEPYRAAWMGRSKDYGLPQSLLVLFSVVKQILPHVNLDCIHRGNETDTT